MPLLKALVKQNGIGFTYVPIDQSEAFLKMVGENIIYAVPGVKYEPIAASYTDMKALERARAVVPDHPALIAVLGSEICCQNQERDNDNLRTFLSNVFQTMSVNTGDRFLASFDPLRRNVDEHCECYKGAGIHDEWVKHVFVSLGDAFGMDLSSDMVGYEPHRV